MSRYFRLRFSAVVALIWLVAACCIWLLSPSRGRLLVRWETPIELLGEDGERNLIVARSHANEFMPPSGPVKVYDAFTGHLRQTWIAEGGFTVQWPSKAGLLVVSGTDALRVISTTDGRTLVHHPRRPDQHLTAILSPSEAWTVVY